MNRPLSPDPNTLFPVRGTDSVTYVKPSVRNPNIVVGEFTYFSDKDFEKQVTHHYDFYGDKLIIGKFCQIAAGVTFVMNGANHQMNAVSTYPFYIMEGWTQTVPPLENLPLKGDTVIGNDVWIGEGAVILPGVHVGDGAIIGAHSVVGSHVAAYTIAAGNPAKRLRRRFDETLTSLMLELQWWNKSIEEIQALIPLLSSPDLEQVKQQLMQLLHPTGQDFGG